MATTFDSLVPQVLRKGRAAFTKVGRAAAVAMLRQRIGAAKKPQHAAFILDGNRRYAVREKLASARLGHEAGTKRFYELLELSCRYGLPNISVYAFSIENFKRSAEEIFAILDIVRRTMDEMRQPDSVVNRLGVRVCIIGDRSRMPAEVRTAIERTEEHTRQNTRLNLFLSVAYDGRDELVRAVHRCAANDIEGQDITQEEISRHTDLHDHIRDVPRCDFLVRTGGGKRLSSFLLWDATHAEIYFTDVLWPEFDEYQFLRSILTYDSMVESSQATDFNYWGAQAQAA